MIELFFESNFRKDDGSFIVIPTIQIWWNWWRNRKKIAIDIEWLFWDIGVRINISK